MTTEISKLELTGELTLSYGIELETDLTFSGKNEKGDGVQGPIQDLIAKVVSEGIFGKGVKIEKVKITVEKLKK